MATLKDLIAIRKRELRLTNTKIAQMCGVSNTTINYLASGRNDNPSLKVLQSLCPVLQFDLGDMNPENYSPQNTGILIDGMDSAARLSMVDPEAIEVAWDFAHLDEHGKEMVQLVIQGEGRRLGKAEEEDSVIQFPKPVENKEGIQLRVFAEPAAAGPGNYIDDDRCSLMTFQEDQVPKGTDFGVIISGQSMAPKIPDKCIAFAHATPSINAGEIGLFIMDGQAYCKQLYIQNDKVVLVSLNSTFPNIEVPPYSDLRTLGKILGWYDQKKERVMFF